MRSPEASTLQHAEAERRTGLLNGLAAYLAWGFVPIFFKQLSHLDALGVLSHRVLWSFLFLLPLLAMQRRFGELYTCIRSRSTMLTLLITAGLIAINWLVFIHAVNTDRVLHASLGYFMTPLVNALLGMLVLKERLRPMQWVGLALAAAGVVNLVVLVGELPWISLVLAGSFGTYGLLRKQTLAGPLVGLSVESALLLPLAIPLAWRLAGPAEPDVGSWTMLLLVLSGTVTALPLLWFANAARRLRLTTLGILQYLAPSCQFLVGVLLYREPFDTPRLISFALIWLALAIYTTDSLRAHRQPRMARDGGRPLA